MLDLVFILSHALALCLNISSYTSGDGHYFFIHYFLFIIFKFLSMSFLILFSIRSLPYIFLMSFSVIGMYSGLASNFISCTPIIFFLYF